MQTQTISRTARYYIHQSDNTNAHTCTTHITHPHTHIHTCTHPLTRTSNAQAYTQQISPGCIYVLMLSDKYRWVATLLLARWIITIPNANLCIQTKQKHAQTEVCRQYAKAVFWYLLALAIIHYYNLQILLLSVSYQYSVLNKVVVCHVEGVEK